jgi:predicted phosphodiesterase
MIETFVFSDLQFGWVWGPITWLFFRLLGRSRFRSNAGALVEVFKRLEQSQAVGRPLRIVLNGDTLDFPNLKWEQLHADEQECILILRRLKHAGADIVVLYGNHDEDVVNLEKVLQLPVLGHEYILNQNSQQILITHGDQFGNPDKQWIWIGDMAVFLFVLVDQVRWLLRMPPYKKYAREMRQRALAFIKATPFRAILIGHNHFASLTEEGGKIFGNSGCVVQRYPLTFMKIDDTTISLMEYNEDRFKAIKQIKS